MIAAEAGQYESMKVLIELGADHSLKDSSARRT
jgi:hypothetical protein